jgi:hypothetical protein
MAAQLDLDDVVHGHPLAIIELANLRAEVIALESERNHLMSLVDADAFRKEIDAVRAEFGWKRDPRPLAECIRERLDKAMSDE